MNVDLGSGVNEFTYKKLFHLLSGNCFITSCLLMENTFGRASKFFLGGHFLSSLGTIDVLIELYPMVPLVAKVTHVVSQPTFAYVDCPPLTLATAKNCVACGAQTQ